MNSLKIKGSGQDSNFGVSVAQPKMSVKNYSTGSNRNEQSTEGAAQNERGNQKRFSMADTVEETDIESARFSRADVDERDFAQRLAESEKARKKLERGMVQAQKTIDMLRQETKASKTKTAKPQDESVLRFCILCVYSMPCCLHQMSMTRFTGKNFTRRTCRLTG